MSKCEHEFTRLTVAAIVQTIALVLCCAHASASEIDGFTTPYRSIDVATAETGTLASIEVREGDRVEQGQVVARLDSLLHAALLATAEKNMQLHGRIASARAERQLRQERHRKLIALLERGSARPEEVNRAKADLDIAQGQLLDIQEQLQIRKLDYEQAKIQLERRAVRSPMAGVVTRLFKETGEFAGPNDPRLMTIVQLDPLLAVFSVPSDKGRRLHAEQEVVVRLLEPRATVHGKVEFVDPVVDGKSGTMRVKVRLSNPGGHFLSGEPCSLLLPDTPELQGDSATPGANRTIPMAQ